MIGHGGLALLGPSASIITIILLYAVRAVPMGLLLTPLVTWGIGSLSVMNVPGIAADGTALLTSIRNVGGSIGAAAFVGIMNAVASHSAVSDAAAAAARGAGAAFWIMVLASVPLFVLYVCSKRAQNHMQ